MNDPETQFVSDTSFSCIWFYNYSDTLPSVLYFAWVTFLPLLLTCMDSYVCIDLRCYNSLQSYSWPYEETWPRSSLSSTRAPQNKHVSAGNRTMAACVTGEHLAKSYSNSLCCCYSEPLQPPFSPRVPIWPRHLTPARRCRVALTSIWTHLYNVLCSNLLELDGLHILEGEAELLPVGEAGLELDEVNGNNTRVPADQYGLET